MELRHSQATENNSSIRILVEGPERNGAWFDQHARAGAVILVGGATLTDFRVRVAQSHLRSDLYPGFWSLAGIADGDGSMWTAPLSSGSDASAIPSTNAIQCLPLSSFDDAKRFPNVAAIRFSTNGQPVLENVLTIRGQRSIVDLPSLLVPWLAFAWGTAARSNPLYEGVGLPSAVMVQTAFAMSGMELSPGLTSTSTCPEAIWQAALWWHDYYRKTADISGTGHAAQGADAADTAVRSQVPEGEAVIRQPAAAVTAESPAAAI